MYIVNLRTDTAIPVSVPVIQTILPDGQVNRSEGLSPSFSQTVSNQNLLYLIIMAHKRLTLNDLRIKSFVTETKQTEKLVGGIYCPETFDEYTYCPSTDPHDQGCASTGNTDDPTGMNSLFIEFCSPLG